MTWASSKQHSKGWELMRWTLRLWVLFLHLKKNKSQNIKVYASWFELRPAIRLESYLIHFMISKQTPTLHQYQNLAAHWDLTAESCCYSLQEAVLLPAQSTCWPETTAVPAPASLRVTTALQQAEDPLQLLHWTKAGAVLTKCCCCSHRDKVFSCSGGSEVLLLSEPRLECFLLGTMQTSQLQHGPREMVTEEKPAHVQSSSSAEHHKSPPCCNEHTPFKI